MSLHPNWIDIPNEVAAMEDNTALSDSIIKDGSDLWGAFIRNAPAADHARPTYKSTDTGIIWVDQAQNVGTNTPSNPPYGLRFRRVIVARGRIIHYLSASDSDNKLWWSTFDMDNPSSGWSAWSSLFTNEYDASLVSDGTLWAGVRPSDNAIILAFQSISGFNQIVRIKKYDGSSWTELGTIGDARYLAVLHYGVIDPTTSHAHLCFSLADMDGIVGDFIPNLMHAAVDSSDDSVTSNHTIENGIEGPFSYGSYIHGPGAVNGTTIAFGYGKDVQTNAYGSSTYGTFKVAIGDMTGDPLNPSWTLTTVNSTPDLSLDFEGFAWVPCGVAFNGSTLEAYYITPYPAPLTGPYPSEWNLWKNTYTGAAWGTPEMWYEPSTDATLDPYRAGDNLDALANFQLVIGFDTGVGIMVDVNKIYAGYEGPQGVSVGNVYFANAGGGPYCPVT